MAAHALPRPPASAPALGSLAPPRLAPRRRLSTLALALRWVASQLLSRLEDESTGEIVPAFLHAEVPEERRQHAKAAAEVRRQGRSQGSPVQMWEGEPGPGADVAGLGEPRPAASVGTQ